MDSDIVTCVESEDGSLRNQKEAHHILNQNEGPLKQTCHLHFQLKIVILGHNLLCMFHSSNWSLFFLYLALMQLQNWSTICSMSFNGTPSFLPISWQKKTEEQEMGLLLSQSESYVSAKATLGRGDYGSEGCLLIGKLVVRAQYFAQSILGQSTWTLSCSQCVHQSVNVCECYIEST